MRIKYFHILLVSVFTFLSVFFSYYLHNYTDTEFLGLSDGFLTKTFRGIFKKESDKEKLNDFLFVDVSQDVSLLTIKNEAIDKNIVITDRQKLILFLERLAQNNYSYRYFLCDIRFDIASVDSVDKKLGELLQSTSKVIFPRHQNTKNIFAFLPTASADYTQVGKYLLKYPLFQGKNEAEKSLPLVMFEKLHPEKNSTTWINKRLTIDYFIKSKDLKSETGTLETLGSLSNTKDINDTEFKKLIANKIIVVGNFSSDKHLTILEEEMAGCVVLANVYLNLLEGNHNTNFLFFIFLFLIIFFPIYTLLMRDNLKLLNFGVYIWGYFLWFYFASFFIYVLTGQIIGFFWIASICVVVKFVQTQIALKNERNKTDTILHSILPEKVVEELKTTGKVQPQRYENVSILFADVNGFSVTGKDLVKKKTALAQQGKTPEGELIKMIDATFSKMDEICSAFGVARIKTIGDCYMAVTGVPVVNPNHALCIVLAALKIQQWMASEYKKKQQSGEIAWRVRLGIHSGSVVAGVIGEQRYAYDVWGDDVNIASRMESKGEVEKINITSDTYQLVKDYFEFTEIKSIELKNSGEGNKDACFVIRLKPEYSKDKEGFEANEKLLKLVENI